MGNGVNIGAGVVLSNGELIAKSGTRLKIAIVLTDGVGDYDPALTAQAAAAGVVIYTIGLGYDIDEALLRGIAAGTGGTYTHVVSAEDLPEVFRRIGQGGGNPDTTDTDGDGLYDWLEQQGIRNGRGVIVNTDPHDPDTDGDGLDDSTEAGSRVTSSFGDYYTMPSHPALADPDGDDLLDPEEVGAGTDPYKADTDGDNLSDATELYGSFDPLNRNPDGDHLNDDRELAQGRDPFHRDLSPSEQGRAFLAGFFWGDSGRGAANLGLIRHHSLHSLEYLAGHLASGLIPVVGTLGDIRDVVASFGNRDAIGGLLSALGIVPVIGDSAKSAKTVAKFLSWAPELIRPVTRWLAHEFKNHPKLWEASLKILRWDERVGVPNADRDGLAAAGNHMGDLAQTLLRGKAKLRGVPEWDIDWAKVDGRVNTRWKIGGASAAKVRVQARAVEAAVEFLSKDHDILYVGTNKPIDLRNGAPKQLIPGPDIVAVNRVTGKLVVVEAKGSGTPGIQASKRLLTTPLAGLPRLQPSFDWLNINKDRYQRKMLDAVDPNIQRAGQLLQNLTDNPNETYEAVVIVSGKLPASWGTEVDGLVNGLDQRTSAVRVIKIAQP